MLQSTKWSLHNLPGCTVQVWGSSSSELGAAYWASWRCRGPNLVWCVCSMWPSVMGGAHSAALYELQSHWKEHTYCKHGDEEGSPVRFLGFCRFLLIRFNRNFNWRWAVKSDVDVIKRGLTWCSPLCLVEPVTEQGLNPVYCFTNCHVVYSWGSHCTLLNPFSSSPVFKKKNNTCTALSISHSEAGPTFTLM